MTNTQHTNLEVSALEAAELSSASTLLIDIRSATERSMGFVSTAINMSAEAVLEGVQQGHPDLASGGYIMCTRGIRSGELVRTLNELGAASFCSISGGFEAWSRDGLAVEYPGGLSALQAERYARHLVIPQVGPDGQQALLRSRILLVGLGGLNSPAALYLAAAGVGTLGLVDDDRVERSNLQRQVIHSEKRVGQMKARSAAEGISSLNPDTRLILHEQRVDALNAAGLVDSWDVVIDGTDNFSARYALNHACVAAGIPLVYGAVMRFQGQVAVFWPAAPETLVTSSAPCLMCMLPEAPAADDAPACAVAGVLGVVPGIVGSLQASEALKLVLGLGQPLLGRLLMFDALAMDFRQARIRRRPDCPCCGKIQA